jgi:DNA invertase Pin-like site-specific DNA recombinase
MTTSMVLDSIHTGIGPDYGRDIMKKDQRIGYVRVSTLDQNPERQLDGIELDKKFEDQASGKDTDRPQLQAALEYLREGDTLIVHSLDRLARNAEDLLRIVRTLTERGVTVEFVKNKLRFASDDSDPMSKLMMTMLAGFSAFERDLIRERQREGIAIAKAKGLYKGRKKALTVFQIEEARGLARGGMPKVEIARKYKVSRQTIYEYVGDAKGEMATRHNES